MKAQSSTPGTNLTNTKKESKWDIDTKKGRERRSKLLSKLNQKGLYVDFIHHYFKTHELHEKTKFNTISQRIRSDGTYKNMGFDCIMEKEGCSQIKYLIIRDFASSIWYKETGGRDCIKNFDEENTIFLFIDNLDNPSRFKIISLKELNSLPGANWRLNTAKNNKNKLEFHLYSKKPLAKRLTENSIKINEYFSNLEEILLQRWE